MKMHNLPPSMKKKYIFEVIISEMEIVCIWGLGKQKITGWRIWPVIQVVLLTIIWTSYIIRLLENQVKYTLILIRVLIMKYDN